MEFITAVFVAIISAGTTIITTLLQNRTRRRNKSGSYILLLIIQDKVDYRIDGSIPKNYDAINDEYVIYHNNGGNGKITTAVKDYNKWFKKLEKTMEKNKGRSNK